MCLFEQLMPTEYREHRRAAKRERLLARRALLDAAIEHLSEPSAKADPAATRQTTMSDFWAHRRSARREEMRALRSLFSGCLLGPMGHHGRARPATETPARIEIV